MTDDDWRLSAVMMAVSEQSRNGVVQHLAQEAEKSNVRRAKADGKRAIVADEVKEEHAVKRVCKNVVRYLQDGELGSSELRSRLASRDRDLLDDVLDRLCGTGVITITAVSNGAKVRLNP